MSARSVSKMLGRQFKIRRIQSGLSQEQLAERVGFTPGHVSKIERGIVSIDVDMLDRFAKALNTSVAALYDWEKRAVEATDIRKFLIQVVERMPADNLKAVYQVIMDLCDQDRAE